MSSLLDTCPHGATLQPYDLDPYRPSKRAPSDPITSHNCDICRIAWQIRGPRSGHVTWDDLKVAELEYEIRRDEHEKRVAADIRWRKALEAGRKKAGWPSKGERLPRARCPACGKECAVHPDDELRSHWFTTKGRRAIRMQCPGRKIWDWTKYPALNLTPTERFHLFFPALMLLRDLDRPRNVRVTWR